MGTIRLLVDDEEFVVPTALEAGDGGAVSFWRRHPFKGLFAGLEVSVPAEGVHVVTVETSANAAGSRGQDSLLLSFHSAEEAFFGGTNFVANIYIATNLTNTVTDTIQYYHGDGAPTDEDTFLAETSAASLVFTGRMEEVGMEIGISGFSGLTTNVDMFTAAMCYNISTNYQPVYSNFFVETSATSGLFRSVSSFTVSRGDLKVTVTPLDGTLPGNYVPVVERIKGPDDLLGSGDCTLEFMGSTFELEEEDGWYYPKGGSPRFWVATDFVPDITNLIYIEPNGTMSVIKATVLDQVAMLNWDVQALFGRKVTLLNIDLQGYEAWRSGENTKVPRDEEEQPGFLITAEVDDVGGVDPLEAKIVALALPVAGGLTRWLRFSDPTKVALTRGGKPVEIPAPSIELQIDGDTTEDAAYQICMLDPEAWAADTSVTVEYFIRDREKNTFPGADKVRLLRPVVVAIGDSLTYGMTIELEVVNGTTNEVYKTPRWDAFWKNYPGQDTWLGLDEPWNVPANRLANEFQGYRGYLADMLPGFLWLGEDTKKHGPSHCGYPGAQTGHINARLTEGGKQYSTMPGAALESRPCYAIVIYLIGANDANRGKSQIYTRWKDGYRKIKGLRTGNGKTLFVAATVPPMEERYLQTKKIDTTAINDITELNSKIAENAKNRVSKIMPEVIVDLTPIKHVWPDDGLHFLPSGYSNIATTVFQGIISGLGAE